MMWYWGGGAHWWAWLAGFVAMIGFWALIVWALWYLVTGLARRPHDERHEPLDARRILDERLARGEIGADEYRNLLAVMRGEYGSDRDTAARSGSSAAHSHIPS